LLCYFSPPSSAEISSVSLHDALPIFGTAILASFVLALINILVRPILVVLTFPITLITLGLFLFVVNALMLQLTHKLVGDGFYIEHFGTALLIALLMSLLNVILNGTALKK